MFGKNPYQPKSCSRCGREITWRRKWKHCWDEISVCSKACRKNRIVETDRQLERTILQLLRRRRHGGSICPSDATKACFGDEPEVWRSQLERTRQAARRLADQAKIEITQGGKTVNPSTMKGPVRLRLRD